MTDFQEILFAQYERYPEMTGQDFAKLIFQSEFGVGHFISSPAAAWKRLQDEYMACQRKPEPEVVPPLFEEIGGGYGRVNLLPLPGAGLSLSTIAQWFILSAQNPSSGAHNVESKLDLLLKLCRSGKIELPYLELAEYIHEFRETGYPAQHHSEVYRERYQPAYRVVDWKFIQFHQVFSQIDSLLGSKQHVLVAIDGYSGAGKSSLAQLLGQVYDCTIFHMDDFFLPEEMKTCERLAEPGGNVHYERFHSEVMLNLAARRPFQYGVFDCGSQRITEERCVVPKRLNIVEGVYSLHPVLERFYDFKIVLQVDPTAQRERILARSGPALLTRFEKEWIPLENRYFTELGVLDKADLVLTT